MNAGDQSLLPALAGVPIAETNDSDQRPKEEVGVLNRAYTFLAITPAGEPKKSCDALRARTLIQIKPVVDRAYSRMQWAFDTAVRQPGTSAPFRTGPSLPMNERLLPVSDAG